MGHSRIIGAAAAFALAVGATTAAPAVLAPAPAQAAAVVSPIEARATAKPRITTQPKAKRIVTVGKTTSFTVRATGGSLKYQWYYVKPGGSSWKKVSGAAGKKRTLTVKATLSLTGTEYRVVVSNARGAKASRSGMLLVRSTLAKPFGPKKIAVTAHWALSTVSSTIDVGDGTSAVATGVVLANYTSKTRNPSGNVVIAFRANNGKMYSDLNASGQSGETGVRNVGKISAGNGAVVYAVAHVPNNLIKGGRWVVKDTASPAMTLHFAQ